MVNAVSGTACARHNELLPTPDDVLAWTLATLVILDEDDREFLRDAMTLYGDLRAKAAPAESEGK